MTIQTVTFSQLLAPKANPRTQIDMQALEGLAASIKADGLLQNLVVIPKKKKFEIVSGERRYRAIALLVEAGDWDADAAIPVEVRVGLSDEQAKRIAIVENVQREALSAVDEAEAFAALVTGGALLQDVAAKAGISVMTVRRRLALASLCDEAKVLLREGSLSLACGEALTLGSHNQQRTVIASFEEYEPDADDIRLMLTEEKPPVTSAIFPIESYTGTFTCDLFTPDDKRLFDDVDQFLDLQAAAVERLVVEFEANGLPVEIIKAGHVNWWQYRQAQEDEDGTVVIHFPASGQVTIRENLTKAALHHSVTNLAPRRGPSPASPQPEYSASVVMQVGAYKTLAVMSGLLNNPRKAREVAVWQMLKTSYHSGVNLTAHPALSFFADDAAPVTLTNLLAGITPFCRALAGTEAYGAQGKPNAAATIRALVGSHRESVKTFERLKLLDDAALEQLHLLLTIVAFGQEKMDVLDTKASVFNTVAAELNIEMRQHWRPDEAFLTKCRKEQLMEIARESGASMRMGKLDKLTKAQLVAALVDHFEGSWNAGVEAAEPDRMGRDWLPGAMKFPAVTAQAEPEVTDEDEGIFPEDDTDGDDLGEFEEAA